MTVQVAVRLPDELAVALDALVGQGEADSRSSVIVSALRRELRRLQDERDIAILSASPETENEFEAMHGHVSSIRPNLDS